MTHVDLLVVGAAELLTLVGPNGETKGPRRNEALGHLGIVKDGAVAIKAGEVVAVGTRAQIEGSYASDRILDARGGIVLPGFVDTHTHLVHGGSRAWELDWKVQGKTYQEITKAGGGIPYTVKETRRADRLELAEGAAQRAREALRTGTTTVEAKSGYGLAHDAEIDQLAAVRLAAEEVPSRLIPTYLGLHEKPPEHTKDPGPYLDEIRTRTLPEIKEQGLATFVDAFIETGVFSPDEVKPVLDEAKRLGFRLRLHVDEFTDLGGAAFAVEMGAASADHLLSVSDDGVEALAKSDTVATLLPLVPFAIRDPKYAPARKMIESGCIVALATDFNPNVPCLNMQTVIQHAVYGMGMRPAEAIVAAAVNAGYSIDPELGLGVLAPGHPADLIVADVPSHVHLAYAFGNSHVRDVVVAGEVVKNGS